MDVRQFDGRPYWGEIDLLAGGVPCPPFSIAGKQLGADDERDLFPQMLRLVEEIDPKVVMIDFPTYVRRAVACPSSTHPSPQNGQCVATVHRTAVRRRLDLSATVRVIYHISLS